MGYEAFADLIAQWLPRGGAARYVEMGRCDGCLRCGTTCGDGRTLVLPTLVRQRCGPARGGTSARCSRRSRNAGTRRHGKSVCARRLANRFPRVKNGVFPLPDGPGLGVEPDLKASASIILSTRAEYRAPKELNGSLPAILTRRSSASYVRKSVHGSVGSQHSLSMSGGGEAEAFAFLDSLQVFKLAVSLGGNGSHDLQVCGSRIDGLRAHGEFFCVRLRDGQSSVLTVARYVRTQRWWTRRAKPRTAGW